MIKPLKPANIFAKKLDGGDRNSVVSNKQRTMSSDFFTKVNKNNLREQVHGKEVIKPNSAQKQDERQVKARDSVASNIGMFQAQIDMQSARSKDSNPMQLKKQNIFFNNVSLIYSNLSHTFNSMTLEE